MNDKPGYCHITGSVHRITSWSLVGIMGLSLIYGLWTSRELLSESLIALPIGVFMNLLWVFWHVFSFATNEWNFDRQLVTPGNLGNADSSAFFRAQMSLVRNADFFGQVDYFRIADHPGV
jgi:hypothetical protein